MYEPTFRLSDGCGPRACRRSARCDLGFTPRPLEHYVHELSEARRLTLEGLAARDDAWLERTLRAAPAMNAHWAWFHVAEDEISHRGQIRWLRARLGSAATGLITRA